MWYPFKKKIPQTEEKASAVSSIIVAGNEGQPVWTPIEYDKLAEEGYQKNVIAYRAIDDISKSAASVPWKLFRKKTEGREEVLEHDILTLLNRPNPLQSLCSFIYDVISYIQVAGNTYIEAVSFGSDNEPQELWTKRPDRMKVVPSNMGISAYTYEVNGEIVTWPVDIITGQSDILHTKLFHPTNDWYGMSPIEAAASSVDIHNSFGAWNLALMQNNAKPSGILVTDGALSNTQILRLKAELKNKWSGAVNAGKPMVLEGGLKWQPMSLSPQDLDWINGQNTSARDIAHAFGYPPFLLGLPGNSTFNNMESAKLWLWENVVFFYLNLLKGEFNNWLIPKFGDESLELDYDISEVPALASRRNVKWDRAINSAGFADINERRAMVGLPPKEGGDVIFISASMIPISDAADFGGDEAEKREFINMLKREGCSEEKIKALVEGAFDRK